MDVEFGEKRDDGIGVSKAMPARGSEDIIRSRGKIFSKKT
jgi:hypothetical protein